MDPRQAKRSSHNRPTDARITSHHTAHSRDTLVRGALRAAEWIIAQPPALYSMADVLGIE